MSAIFTERMRLQYWLKTHHLYHSALAFTLCSLSSICCLLEANSAKLLLLPYMCVMHVTCITKHSVVALFIKVFFFFFSLFCRIGGGRKSSESS